MAETWEYSTTSKRFRAVESGRFVAGREVAALRDQFASAQRGWSAGLATAVKAGQITPAQFEATMRDRVRLVHSAEYLLAKGGVNAATAADRRAIGKAVAAQTQHLAGFARDLAAGKLSEKQVAARSQMYFNAATATHERGKTAGMGMPDLPAYPGDGSTVCGVNCKCEWVVDEDTDGWRATWQLNADAESCDDCLERAAQYSPLVIAKGEG